MTDLTQKELIKIEGDRFDKWMDEKDLGEIRYCRMRDRRAGMPSGKQKPWHLRSRKPYMPTMIGKLGDPGFSRALRSLFAYGDGMQAIYLRQWSTIHVSSSAQEGML